MYVAWSDGSLQSVYAPSLVVQEHLVIEANHPIGAIRPVHDAGLPVASTRGLTKYGYPHSQAANS